MKIKSTSRKKKIILIVSAMVAVAVLVVGVYAWLSYQSWKNYETRLKSTRDDLTELRDTALNGQNPEARLQAIRELDDAISKDKDVCEAEPAFAWQADVVPVIRQGITECERAFQELERAAEPLSELRDYLDTASGIQKAIGENMVGATALGEKDWKEEGLQPATELRSSLNTLVAASDDAKTLKSDALDHADELVEAWTALIKAHDAKNKDQFIKASERISQAYAAFAGLADDADDQIKKLAAPLNAEQA